MERFAFPRLYLTSVDVLMSLRALAWFVPGEVCAFVPSLTLDPPPEGFFIFLAVTLEFGSSAGAGVVGADVLCSVVYSCTTKGLVNVICTVVLHTDIISYVDYVCSFYSTVRTVRSLRYRM